MFPGDDKYASPIGAVFESEGNAKVKGQLRLRRAGLLDSVVVSISEDTYFRVSRGESLHGISEAGKVSLLDCQGGGSLASTQWDDFGIYHGNVSFRQALFGRRHVAPDQDCIRGMQFKLEGVERSVFLGAELDAFGLIHDPHEEILDAISRHRPDYLKGEFVKGRAKVSYFTGSYDLLPRTQTALGTVSASRIVNTNMSSASQGPLRIEIDFSDEPTTVEGALDKMREVRQFFAWIMGYAPAWSDVLMFTASCDEDGRRVGEDGRRDEGLEVFGPNEWKEAPDSARHYGTLIDATRHAEHFMAVMAKWLERNRDASRRSANERYFGSLHGRNSRVVEDGIVSAANTFDLLPSSDKPPSAIREDTRQRAGKEGSTRTNARVALRSVVEHRAKRVLDHFGYDQLQGLDAVIRQAVFCRNHFTHGPDKRGGPRLDFSDLGVVLFLTETLEFIYAASELLLCGWNEAKSRSDYLHPLGGYVKRYGWYRSSVGLE